MTDKSAGEERHRTSHMVRVLLALTMSYSLLAAPGCGGSGDPPPSGNDCDAPALFEANCNGAGCHGSVMPSVGLDLVSPGVEDRVANKPASQSTGLLADPSNATGSVIYDRVLESPTSGARMPLASPQPLSDEDVMCIRDWISGLLPPPAEMPDAMPQPDGATECPAGAMETCYTGPADAEDVGICAAGMRVCETTATGTRWGPCTGDVMPAPEQCANPDVDEDCNNIKESCDGRELWNFSLAYPFENQAARSVAVDSEDNILVAGDFASGIDLGDGPIFSVGTSDNIFKNDPFLAKYDSNGNLLWKIARGDTSTQNASQVIVDADDNVILLGRAFGKINFGESDASLLDAVGTDDIFIIKFDKDGNHLWSTMVGGDSADRAERMVVNSSGDVWVTGTFTSSASFGNFNFTSEGVRDIVLFRLDADSGAVAFAMQAGGALDLGGGNIGDNYGFGIDVDASDNVYLAGYFTGTARIGTGPDLTSTGGKDLFMAKLDADGNHVWSKRFGDLNDDFLYDLVVDDSDGSVAITGYFDTSINFGGDTIASQGSLDLFLAKFDTDGVHQFSAGFGDSEDQHFFDTFDNNTWSSLDIDANGNLLLAAPLVGAATFDGTTLTSPEGRMDILIVKFAPNGDVLFSQLFGGGGTQIVLDVAATNSGHAVLAGRFFSSSVDFGTSGIALGVGLRGDISSGGDGFVARIVTQ
ncbi:MAG: hypothetical protein Tsb0020_10220 [Haliangiales bacterium]